MYVTPAPGLTIRDPDLRDHLPPEGRDVPTTDYWHRRVSDGDVLEGAAPKAVAAAAPATSATPATSAAAPAPAAPTIERSV